MPDRNEGVDHSQATKRTRRLWLIPVTVAVLAVAAWLLWVAGFWRDSRSADERLAEIEATRAIPDSENAAIIYNELLQDPNAKSLLTYCPDFLEPPIVDQVRDEPWLGKDHPQLVGWIKEHQYIIDRLLVAAQFEKCRFPISIDIADTSDVDRAAPMRQWGFLLSIAANNDVAEGRTDAALMKWRCLLRMGDHLCQQPLCIDQLVGMAVEKLALEAMAVFIMTDVATGMHLQNIEAMALPLTEANRMELLKTIHLVEDLSVQKLLEPLGPLDRLKFHFEFHRMMSAAEDATGREDVDPDERMNHLYLREVAIARGLRILTALRRHRDEAGRWPESLDEIKSLLPEEIPTALFNKGSFVYQPTGDGFRLYSRGKNNLDEGGKWDPDAGPDDWPIWPPRGRDSEAEQHDANGV